MLQALCNAVISASVEKNEDKDALQLLAELLAQDAVDPNAGDEALWDIVSRQHRIACFYLKVHVSTISALFRLRCIHDAILRSQ